MDDVKATKDKPRKVYERQHLDGDGEGPRNIKQVKNAAQRVRDGLQRKSSGNLADEIQSLLTRMSSEGAQSWLGQHQWSNNNCESANHLLKMQVQ